MTSLYTLLRFSLLLICATFLASCAAPPSSTSRTSTVPAQVLQPGALDLQQDTAWRLRITSEVDSQGQIRAGKYEFRGLNCGGSFSVSSRNAQTGEVVLQQHLEYGRCVPNCRILLAPSMASYREECNGRIAGQGVLSGANLAAAGTNAPSPAASPAAAATPSLPAVPTGPPQLLAGNLPELRRLCETAVRFQEFPNTQRCNNELGKAYNLRNQECQRSPDLASRANCVRRGQDFERGLSSYVQYHTLRQATTKSELALFIQQFSSDDPLGLLGHARTRLQAACEQQADCVSDSMREARLTQLRGTVYVAGSIPELNCINALPSPHANSTAAYYGTCLGSNPDTGIIVWSVNNRPVDLGCIAKGKLATKDEIRGFDACEPHWARLPNGCKVGEYRGQCVNGAPNGVGVLVQTTVERTFNETPKGLAGAWIALGQAMSPGMRSHKIQRGQFNGELNGYGYFGSVSGCGMAGCSGQVTQQTGWFKGGKFEFACATIGDCLSRVSGAAYTNAGPTGSAADLARLRGTNTFDAALKAYDLSRDSDDLRRANGLAKTQEERARLESSLFRVAGYDKILSVSAAAKARNGQDIPLAEKERILGYIRSTSAELPLTINWSIGTRPDTVPLRYGNYLARVVVGLRIKHKKKTCFGDMCRNEEVSETFTREVQATLTPNRKTASGSFDLKTTSASASSVFGVANMSNLIDAEPFVRIESLTLQP
jgi:hypothetical protein